VTGFPEVHHEGGNFAANLIHLRIDQAQKLLSLFWTSCMHRTDCADHDA
jgi:hypothetical protein